MWRTHRRRLPQIHLAAIETLLSEAGQALLTSFINYEGDRVLSVSFKHSLAQRVGTLAQMKSKPASSMLKPPPYLVTTGLLIESEGQHNRSCRLEAFLNQMLECNPRNTEWVRPGGENDGTYMIPISPLLSSLEPRPHILSPSKWPE